MKAQIPAITPAAAQNGRAEGCRRGTARLSTFESYLSCEDGIPLFRRLRARNGLFGLRVNMEE